MAKGLRDLLDRVLYVQVGPERSARSDGPSKIATLDFSFLTFDEMLSDRVADDGSGTFQVMSLRSFKEAIADEWDKHRRTIGLATENTIFQHLRPRDRCAQEDDDTYLFLFDVPNGDIAGERLRALTTDLMQCLIGDRFAGVRAQLVEVGAEDITDETGALDPQKLDAVLAEAPVVTLETTPAGEPMLVEIEVTDRRRDDPDWQEDARSAETDATLVAGGRRAARLVEMETTGGRSTRDWEAMPPGAAGPEARLAEAEGRRGKDLAWEAVEGGSETAAVATGATRTVAETAADLVESRGPRDDADWQALPATGPLAGGPDAAWRARQTGEARLVDDGTATAESWQAVLVGSDLPHHFLPPLGGWSQDREETAARLVTVAGEAPADRDPWAGAGHAAWTEIATVTPPAPDRALGPVSPADFVIVSKPAPEAETPWPASTDRPEAAPLPWPGLALPIVTESALVRSMAEAAMAEARLVTDRSAPAADQTPIDWPVSTTREIETPPLVTDYAGQGEPEIAWHSRAVVEVDGVDTPGRWDRVSSGATAAGPDWGRSVERDRTGQMVRVETITGRQRSIDWEEGTAASRPAPPAPAARAPGEPSFRGARQATEWGWMPTLHEVADEPDFHPTPDPGAAREPAWGSLAWPPPGLQRPGAPALPEGLAEARLPAGLTAGYWPAWNAMTGRVDTFVAVPMRSHDGEARPSRVVRLMAGAPAALRTAVDLALLHATLKRIEENIEARKRLMLVLPLHVETLCSENLGVVRGILEAFPAAASARYLYLELTDWPANLTEAAMAPLRNRLPTLCRDVLLRVDAHGPPPRAIADLRAAAIGFDLGPLGRRRCPVMGRPAGGLRTYVWGVDDPDGLGQVIADGHWLTNGPELGPPVGVPSDDEPMRLSPVVNPARLAARTAATAKRASGRV